jgi:hypothetical protein
VSDTPLRAIRVPDPLWTAARAAATRAGTSVSAVCRAALVELVDDENAPTAPDE